jgi:TonB family protein
MLPLVVAQIITPSPSPTAARCARPFVLAETVKRAEPILPASAEGIGLRGTVQVVVTLDADGAVTGARIASSPSGMLNEPALAAARASTFRPQIRDCRPVGGDYTYAVEFESRVTAFPAFRDGRIVSVAARGTVLRAPDSALVYVRTVAKDASADRASAKSDALLRALMAKLRGLGITDAKVHQVSVSPRSPVVLESDATLPQYGFAATRIVSVAIEPENAAETARAIAASGSFEITGIDYALYAAASAFEDALRAAIDDAETRARIVASAYHLRVGPRRDVQLKDDDTHLIVPGVYVRYPASPDGGTHAPANAAVPRVPVSTSATIVFELVP